MTPAQAYGHPTLDDVPVAGPTDPGILKADCWWAQNVLPTPQNASCVDCKGPIPMWANHKMYHGVGEQISFGGVGVSGFALTASDSIWEQVTPTQQAWIAGTITAFNRLAYPNGSADCPGSPEIQNASRCFQRAFNGAIDEAVGKGFIPTYNGVALKKLNTFGVFDIDTLCALVSASIAKNLPAPPADLATRCQIQNSSSVTAPAEKISTGSMVGIGVAGAAVIGGIAYAVTRGKKRGRNR